MTVSSINTDVLTASLGKPIVLAYGRHVVGGNIVLKDDTDPAASIVFLALGEGEWDGVESLQVNGADFDITIPQNYQFHKGLTGQLSANGTLDPEGTGSIFPFTADGDQKADALTPPGVQGLTFSRTAYLALRVPFDVFAPTPDLVVRGVFRCKRVRFFNSSGVQTGYAWSENPAWQIADLLTVVRGLSDSRIDWASFVTAADYCDALISINGANVKRFVSHVAFTAEVNFDEALEAILATCRGSLLDVGGVIQLRIDQARAAVFDFTMDNIVDGSFTAWRKDTRATANRLEMLFRDPDNDHAVLTKLWNHEPQQARTGRVIPAKLSLGNMPQHQAERIGNYLLTRAHDNNLFCGLRGQQDSLKVLPGDVVRVKHDAAPWGTAPGGTLFQEFEVLEVTEHPDEQREFLCRVYNAATYTDTAGAGQNLIGTTVRSRPPVPANVQTWDLSADQDGSLRLGMTIPSGADYRTGELTVLEEIELLRTETVLAAAMDLTQTTMQVASSSGFAVGEFVNKGKEVLKIAGPGVENAEPTSTTWQVARGQNLSQPQTGDIDDPVYRLVEREFNFAFRPGFTLARAGQRQTVKFAPGSVRILHAALRFTNAGGVSEAAELGFSDVWESALEDALFGTLPGLRVTSGRLATIRAPGPLRIGDDLAEDLFLEAGIAIGIVKAELASPSLGGPLLFRVDSYYSDGSYEAGGVTGLLEGATESGPIASGAKATVDTGNRRFRLVVTAVGPTFPGEDLTFIFTY